jgi:hypothetical protein
MLRQIRTGVLLVGLVFLCFTQGAAAQDRSERSAADQTRAIIELLQKKGLLSEAEAAALLEPGALDPDRDPQGQAEAGPEGQAEAQADPQAELAAEVEALAERVRRTDEAMMTDHRLLQRRVDTIEKGPLDTLLRRSVRTGWAERISLAGDLRLRYQGDSFAENNALFVRPDNPELLLNTTEDRHRYRYRARLDLKADLPDFREANVGKVDSGFRISTGSQKDPVSTNITMGDYFNRDTIALDRAYLQWRYRPIHPKLDRMPQLRLVGGRFANPWFSTDLVWDADVNFEGAAIGFRSDTEQWRPLNLFATAGIFSLHEEEFSQRDKWFWGAQIGIEYRPRFDFGVTLGVAYYDYRNIEGVQNDPARPGEFDFTAPQFQQKGNTLMDIDPTASIKTALASDFSIVDAYLNVVIGVFSPVQIVLDAQYVTNIGFDRDRVARVTGNENPVEDIDGYLLGITVGHPTIFHVGEWNLSLQYKYLGADAVLDAFTDSDFHLGGTNAKGWVLKAEMGLYRNVWLTARWLSADQISGPALGVDTVQIDLNARF